MKKLIVTGSHGFLGQAISRHFLAGGWEILGIDRNPLSVAVPWSSRAGDIRSHEFSEMVSAFRPDAVVHAAGSANVQRSLADPLEDFTSGPALVMHLLDALRKKAPQARVVFLSSAAVYGQPKLLPIAECAPCLPISPYGYHKWMSELACQQYATVHGQPIASARIFSGYGAGLRKQVVWDLCRKATASWKDGALQGTGTESRDFIHARDIARAVECLLLRAPMLGESYNLASGKETSIRDLAALVMSSLGVTECPVFDGKVPSGVPVHWRADISAIRSLGFAPEVSIDQGIAETAGWFQSLSPAEIH